MRVHALGTMLAVGLTACATMPDVSVKYYLPKATLQTSVVRTIACDVQDNAIIATNVITKMTYTPDDGRSHTISLKSADSVWGNTETGFTLLEDGRLGGFNTTQVGQGGEIAKSAMVFAGAVLAAASADPDIVKKQCQYVRDVGKDKGLTLTFVDRELFATEGPIDSRVLEPSAESAVYFENVKNILGNICLSAKPVGTERRIESKPHRRDAFNVVAVNPAKYQVTVKQDGDTACKDDVWSGVILVPQHGQTIELPVRRAALFGKQTAAFTFAESGAPTSIKYGKDSGAAASLGAANEILGMATKTDAEDLAALKLEADLIAQQQRIIRCKANPAGCS